MRGRLLVMCALLAAYGGSAAAAPRHCLLITDAARDETPLEQGPEAGDRPDLDVVSGDLASNATTMTAVVRVRAFDQPVGSATYHLVFTTPRRWFEVGADVGVDGTFGYLETYDVGPTGMTASGVHLAPPAVTVDRANGEVRMTFPLETLAPYASTRPGAGYGLFRIGAYLLAGSATPPTEVTAGVSVPHSLGLGWDSSDPGRSYRLGSPSCVRVG